MKKLIESGYSPEDLINSGLPPEDVINASRSGVLYDSRDRQTYKTVQIGSQVWMAENLNIGNRIDSTSSPTDNSVIEKYCYRDMEANCAVYGALYKWDEMMNYTTFESGKGICPDGWHMPSDEEWKILEMHLGMTPDQADNSNYRGTDQGSQIAGNEPLWLNGLLVQIYSFESSGFYSLPGGYLNTNGFYFGISRNNYFWTSSSASTLAYWRSLGYNNRQIYRQTASKNEGYSVRCIQD
jgi:uncharacterized protein (TIGR02145 family)